MHHEADHEERAELELAGRERGADRKPFAEVVDADPDRDEQREREPGHTGASAREPGRDERHPERARGNPEEDEAGAPERRRQRCLQLERLRERLDAEEGQEAAR